MAYNVKNSKTVTAGKVRKKPYRFPSGWTKNVLKSFGYSAQDVISELMPNTVKIGSTAREASNELKDAFSLAKDKTQEGVDFGKKKLQEFKDTEFKEAMEDLRSGKLYNKERIQEKDDASFGDFGLDFDDSSFDSELDFGDDVSGDMSSTDDNTFVDVDLNIGEDSPIVQSQDATTAAVVSSTQVVATTTKESSAALSAVVASLSATMSTKMDLFTSELSKLSTTVPEIMSSQAVLRSEYYEKSLSYQERMVLALENLNAAYHGANGLAGIAPANRYDDPRLKSTLSDKMYFDVDQYKDMVKDNAKSFAENSMIGMMLSQVIDMYKMQNEMGAGDNRGLLAKGLNIAMKTAIPGAVKGVMKSLDEFVDGMVLPIGMRIAELSKNWSNPILSSIGNIFGIKTSAQTSATKNTYNKGPVAFDGKVYRAITDVIPTYLRMIASAVTGKEEIAFDYEKGVFNTVSNMKKEFEKEIRREAIIPQSTQISRFGNSVNKMDNLSDSQKDMLKNTFEDLMYEMANAGGRVSFRKQGDRDDIARLLNKSSDDPAVQFIRNYFEAMYDEGQHADLNSIFSTSMLRSRENIDKIYKEMSVDGLSHNFHLVNNGLDETQENGVKINNTPSFISDKYGRTSVSYLRDILITLNNGIKVFNVQGGGSGGGGSDNTVLSNSRAMLDRLTADDTSLRERLSVDGSSNNPSESSGELRYDDNFINVVRDYIHESDPSDSTIDMLDNLSIFFDEDSHIGKSIAEKIKRRRETNRRIYDIGNVLTGAGIDLIYGQREGSVLDKNGRKKEAAQDVEVDGHTYSLGEDGKVYDDNGNVVGKKRQKRLDQISNGQITALATGALTVENDSPAGQVEKAAKSFARHAENFGTTLKDKVFAPLKTALFDDENGLIRKMYDTASSFKTTLAEKILGTKDDNGMYKHGLLSTLVNAPRMASNKAKSWKDALINGNTDENTPEFIKKVRNFIGTESVKNVEVDGHTYSLGEDGKVYDDNGNVVGKKRQKKLDKASDGKITALASGKLEGKLDIKGKGKGLVADAKSYIIKKSYELTDSIFGKEEDGSHMLDRFKSDMKGNGGKIGGAAAVGLLGGLFMPFGPIGGAILTSGLAIATKSTQLKDFLFGKENEDGTREDNGVISKEWQDRFKKYGVPAGVGVGVGLITSLFLPGGPLLLPVIGAMTGIATKTEAFSKMLYGENGTKDDPTGGLGKYVKDHYGQDKTISDAVKDTGIGAGLGIMGSLFLPGGPVIGAILGGTMAIARKTDAWSRMLYGEDGTKDNPTGGLSKIIKEHYNKDKTVNASFLDAGIGAGVGILGSFFLPGGPLLGAIIGAGSSLILNSERVQEYLFGPKGEDGKRHGGFVTNFTDKINTKVKAFTDNIMDSFHETTDKLSLWMSENVINPLKVSYKPIAERIKRNLNDVKDGFKDFLFGGKENSVKNKAKGLVGLLAEEINNTAFGDLKKSVQKNVIEPLEKGFRKLFNGFFSMIGSIIKAPVAAIQAIAESSEKKNGGDPRSIQRKINELNAESRRKLDEKKAAREKRKAERAKRKTPPENRTADNTERIVTAEEQQLTEQRGFFATVTGFFNELLSNRRERRRSEGESVETLENTEGITNETNDETRRSKRKKRKDKRRRRNNSNQSGSEEALPNATEVNPDAILNSETNNINEDDGNTTSSENGSTNEESRSRRNEHIRKIQDRYRKRQEEKAKRRQEAAARRAAAKNARRNSTSSTTDASGETTEDKGNLINKLDPDNKIGRNVAKIARNLDGNINGLGFNVNRIYTLLKRKLGGGGTDDGGDNEGYKNRKYYTPLQRAFRFITAPFRLVGRVVESLYTGVKKAVFVTVGGIAKAGKLLVDGIFDVAKGMLGVAKHVIGIPAKLIEATVNALPGILKGAANFVRKAAKGFGNLVSGAFTGLAAMLQGLGVLGGEAVKLLAKGGVAGVKFLAKGGAAIVKGVAGVVGGVLGKLFKDKNADSSSWRNKREVIITGGKLDAIEVIKLVEKVNGVSDSSENSLSINDNNEDRPLNDDAASTTGEKKSFKDRVREGWSTVKGKTKDNYDRVRDYAGDKYDQATGFLRNQWDNARGYVGSGLGQVAGFAGNFWNGARDNYSRARGYVGNEWNRAKGFTKNKWKSAKATAADLAESGLLHAMYLKDALSDTRQRATSSISNLVDTGLIRAMYLGDTAKGAFGRAKDKVKDFGGRFHSPFKRRSRSTDNNVEFDDILDNNLDDGEDTLDERPNRRSLHTLFSRINPPHHRGQRRERGKGLFGSIKDFGGAVSDIVGELRREINPSQSEQSSAIHVIVDGGYLNYIGGIGGSFSDNVDDDLNIEDEVEEGADNVRGAAGRGLRNRIRKFGEKLRDKGDKAVGMAGGLASSIFSRFKQEDKDAEEREWREAMLHQTREGTDTAKKSHFDWSAIFSKKGLITMVLVAAIPFILKNFDSIVGTIGSLVTTVKSGLDKIGGLLGLGNKVGEQVGETVALATGDSKQFVTDDAGNVVLDENGKPVTETVHQDKIKDRVDTYLNPKQTVVDEDGNVVLKDDTHVSGLRHKAIETMAKKMGKKTRKFVTAVGDTKIGKKIGEKTQSFLSKHGSNITVKAERGIIAGGKFIKGAASKIKGAASGFVGKITKSSADDVAQVVSSSKVGTIIKYCKTAVEKLIEKVGPVLKKFKADKLLSKITSIVSKFSDKLFTPGIISKALGKFTKILGKMATAAGTLLTSDLFWAATGAISGASRPGELFQVHEDEVDVKMTAISAIFGGILNTSWGGWIDVIDNLCLEVMGFSFVTWFAVNVVYKALASKDEEEALDTARKQFESDYTDHVDEVYDAYVKSQEAEGKSYMTKDEFKASELAPSWTDYIDEQNPTFWQKTKKAFSSPTNFKNAAVGLGAKLTKGPLSLMGKGGKSKNSQTAPSMLNGFPYMSQNDPNINTVVPMGDGTKSTLGETGCAPTAMAMVASQIKGQQVNPALLADFAAQNGLSTSANGTMPQFINASSQMLGLNTSLVSPTADSIKSTISSGSPVIIQGQGDGSNTPFTPDGHYVVGVGTKNGKILVNDPEGKQYSKAYDANVLANGAANVWAFLNSPADSFNKYNEAITNNTNSLQSVGQALADIGTAGKKNLTQDKLRQQVVDAIMSRLGKNEYTQSSKRTQVGSGYGDCSSTVRWAYMTGANIDPGGYSGAQYINKLGVDVDNTAGSPDESKLKPGDILFYKRNSSSYTDKVGHVEMYVGNGQRAGHGSGIGPKLTPLSRDAKSYLKARRFITDSTDDYDSPELGAAENATGNGTSGDTSLSSTEINNANTSVYNQQTTEANGEKGASLLSILGEWITGIKDKIQERVFGIKPVSDTESSVVNSFSSSVMDIGNSASNVINGTNSSAASNAASSMMRIGNTAINVANPTASTGNAAMNLGNAAKGVLTSGSDYLGKYTAQFESGGRGPATISTGKGDHGGVSFGTYQFASHNKAQADPSSALATFWNNNYASQYPGVVPGNNDAFKKAWVDAATKNPDDFSAKEAAYFGNTFYIKQRDKLADIINIDKDRGLQEATFATAVQYGPNTGVIRDALSGKNANNMNPVDAINTIEDYKANTVKKYFKSSPSIWGSLSNRFNNTERKQMTSLSGQKPVQLINTGGKGGKLNMLGGFGKGVVTDSAHNITDSTTSIGAINQFTSVNPSEDKYFKDTMDSIIELLQAIVDNTLGINNGVQSLNAKEPQSILIPNSASTQSHNTITAPSSKGNSDIDSKYYNAAKQISSGVYKRA